MSTQEIKLKTNIRKGFIEEIKTASKKVKKDETAIFGILGQNVKIVYGDLPDDGDVDNVGGSFKNDNGDRFHFFIQ
jgi:hypothetical protein